MMGELLQFVDTASDFLAVLIAILFYLYWKFVPNNGAMLLKIKTLERKTAEYTAEVETGLAELWDYVEQTLAPIRNRLATRARKEKEREEDLKGEFGSSKQGTGGILTPDKLKKYGINRQT